MYKKHSIKTSIVAGILLMTTLGLLVPSTSASPTIDEVDGIWTDDFKYDSLEEAEENLTIDNCKIDPINGVISLYNKTHPRSYSFDEEDFPHKASVYRSIFFLPRIPIFFNFPDNHLSSQFNDRDYDGIKVPDDDSFATRTSSGVYRNVIQEFRFQFDVGADSIGSIEVYWKGEVDNADNVELYYWTLGEYELATYWKELNSSTDNTIEFNETIDAENASLAVTEDNYFYICVVATSPKFLQVCSLSSDYIEISSLAEEAWDKGPGTITTNTTVAPPDNFYWEMLTWRDYEPEQTSIRYQILYDLGDGNFTPIPDEFEYFSGSNENGFSSSPVYLNKIPTSGSHAITELRINANLTSQTASKTPKLYNWAVTWQKNPVIWEDSFNSSYRIGSKSKINVIDGSVNISTLQGEWPMFGYNSENTRSTDGKGPQSSDPPLKWYSSDEQTVGGEFRNPVIGDDSIYIFNKTDGIIKYNIQGNKPNSPANEMKLYPGNFMNSPAITEDYIIIASGKTNKGGYSNRIRGQDKDLSNSWWFDYNEPICYYSSPVVYDNKIFITSWNGDTRIFSDIETNKVIALDLDKIVDGTIQYDNDDDLLLWEYDLPAGSYSTPAVYNDMVFVGCSKSSGDSFFVLDAQGNEDGTTNLIWSADVGAIGRSSPVIYDDTVFVTSKSNMKIQITALDIANESSDRILWQKSICLFPVGASADSSPAVYDDVLYVASPRGTVYALDTANGETLWSNNIYTNLLSNYLTSSPVYADGYLYIGTPAGEILALDTQDNGSIAWGKTTFQLENFANAPILSSPIVSNEMLFIADETGVLYGFGTYEELNEEMDGSITSIPINLPTGDWWGKFYVNYTSETGSTIKFSILDNNENHIKNISDGDSINLGSRPNLRSIYLHADLTATNLSVNPILRSWKITFEPDDYPPELVTNSFEPNPEGWLNTPTPECSIDVWDNESGLVLSESTFTITYDTQNDSDLEKTYTPEYTGENGVNFSKLTADISKLPISQNITNLTRIVFKVRDFADNEKSVSFNFKQDKIKPTSSVSDETNGSQFTSEFVVVNATAEDAESGVILIELYYRHSYSSDFSGEWTIFDNSTETSHSWNFTDKNHGGYYELCTIAYDEIDNVEEFPEEGDVWFIFDNEPPEVHGISDVHWFKELPTISIEFSDDFLLDTIKYKPEFETKWTVIDSDINKQIYDSEWELPQEHWDKMEDEKQYTLYFWINDSLGNTQIIDENGYKIVKDEAEPDVDLEIPNLETEWSFEDTFTISAFATDGNGSGIKSVKLFYRYSEDGDFNGTWISYGVLTSEPFEWEFEADEGNGYYEFKIVAEDVAGNVAESEVFSTGINLFPVYSVVAMVILIIALILITFVIFIKWRKK